MRTECLRVESSPMAATRARPAASVIIPAFNAARTLDRALRSVAAQVRSDWEAVVVDDGSADGTAELAAAWAGRDPRVRLVRRPNGGASAARNTGVAHARADWLVFLDADDTLTPDHLRRLLARTEGAGVVVCGWTRRAEDGRRLGSKSAPRMDRAALRHASRWTPVAIHAALVRRDAVQRAGGFDETLRTHEDWDLWLRLARSPLRWAVEPRRLATYWDSAGSLTKDPVTMSADYRTVLERSRRPDPRLPDGGAVLEPLAASNRLADASLWSACLALASGLGVRTALDCLPGPFDAPWDLAEAGGAMVEGWAVGAGVAGVKVVDEAERAGAEVAAFAEALEARERRPGLAYGLVKVFEREALRIGDYSGQVRLSRTAGVTVGPGSLLRDVPTPGAIDSVVFRIAHARPRSRFMFEAPAYGPVLPAAAARDALTAWTAAKLAPLTRKGASGARRAAARLERPARRLRGALRRFGPAAPTAPDTTGEAQHASAGPVRAPEAASAREAARAEAARRLPPPPSDPGAPAPEPDAWQPDLRSAWDAFFAAAADPWGYDTPYEEVKYRRTAEMTPPGVGRALEIGCAEGRFTVRLAARCTRLRALDVSAVALARAGERCAAAGAANVEFVVGDVFHEPIEGRYDLVTCSEMLYYLGAREDLEPLLRKLRDALEPGGHLLHAHAFELGDDPGRTAMDWRTPFGGQAIHDALKATPGLELVRSLRTELYVVDLFRRTGGGAPTAPPQVEHAPLGAPLEPRVARHVVWNGAVRTRADAEAEPAAAAPVLMYHRIAEDGPDALAPYRTSPAAFEHQLRFLRRRGFHSLSPEAWDAAARSPLPLRGRPVMITFDDAYVDFAEAAWPILERNGFTAHVFAPTDKVGGAADWDAGYGEPAPIMDWPEIRALAARGVTFGSHLASHTRADLLDTATLLEEAARSRALLERAVGRPVRTVAPPFGAVDARTAQVLRQAGFTRLFLAHGGAARPYGPPLATPRIEVRGDDDIEAFAAKLGRLDEPPSAADVPGAEARA